MSNTDTIVRVDPKTLLLGPNVRKEITLHPDFVAGVKEHGVLVPIIAQQTPDGLDVIDGQMRTLAALDAGLTEVPVFIRDVVDEAGRIVDQLVVNNERFALSTRDEVAAVRQLALDFKMPAAAIAKRVGAKKADVEKIITVSGAPAVADAMSNPKITLDIAAKIAEAGLNKTDLKRVTESHFNPEHALQKIIDERTATATKKQLEAQAKKDGLNIVERPSKGDYNAEAKNKHLFLDQLVDKTTGDKITVIDHTDCPGHAVWIGARGYGRDIETHYLCTDPSKNGHRDRDRAAPKPPPTDEERTQRATDNARNAEWPSITTVRLTWIREQLLARRGAPAAGWEYLVIADITNEYGMTWGFWQEAACNLLQLTPTDDHWNKHTEALRAHARTNAINAAKVALAAFIARHEHAIAEKKAKGWTVISPIYLRLLDAWGYGLSELEQSILAEAPAEK